MMMGLDEKQVAAQREKYGKNIIVEAEPETFWQKIIGALGDPMIRILIFIVIIFTTMKLLGHGDWSEIIGVSLAIVIFLLASVRTEMASDNEYRKLKDKIEKEKCKVYRHGKVVLIEMEEVVVGDYVLLQSGDKIPADGVLISGGISVDNASLNGETEECQKKPHPSGEALQPDQWQPAVSGDMFVDTHSLFKGAVTVADSGVMLVTKVGMSTVMGEMAADMASDEVDSPLKVKLTALAGKISMFGYIGAVVIGLALMSQIIVGAGGLTTYFATDWITIVQDVLNVLMLAVVIVVMAVPEGLPLMIAIVLMQNTTKLLNDHVLVRKPVGIETAGSLNILFSDKTGTITKGELEVVEFFNGDLIDDYGTNQQICDNMRYCIGRNTAALFDERGNVIGGNFTDKALMNFLTEPVFNEVKEVEIEMLQEFNSANKYSAAQLAGQTYYKGAPEVLMQQAQQYIDQNGAIVPLTPTVLAGINRKIDELASKSMRVLAFAVSPTPLVKNELSKELILVGFLGIRDDVRPEARTAIHEVKNAGIQVVMITGDRKETAIAIAKDCGLIESDTDIALTSQELNALSDEEIKQILPNIRVIARALPTDKSRMVKISQELNLVCGMTGDGVNDAPALKRADVGFAMGSGTDVAKEVADIVILDDNFQSIENAILYGRTIYNNIQKFIKFQLTINVAAVAISAIAPFIGIEQPLTVIHILWINLIMDGLGALALGAEPALKVYMNERPKKRTENIVTKAMMTQVLVTGAYVTGLSLAFLLLPFFQNMFATPAVHITAYFSLFVLMAVFNGFNVRSEGIDIFVHMEQNKGFTKVMGLIVVIQIILTYVGGDLFDCAPLAINNWFVVIGLAVTIIPVDMLRKVIFKTKTIK
ncbi:MAG: cation-translocating P-type ATPase [Culicoidibacterales bacterium]